MNDEGRIASRKAYRALSDIIAAIDAAITLLRAVDLEKTVYTTEILEEIGYLEAVRNLIKCAVPRLADMALSDDWLGHRDGKRVAHD